MLIWNVIWKELGLVIEMILLHTRKNNNHIFLTKLFVLMFFTGENIQLIDTLKKFLESMNIAEK